MDDDLSRQLRQMVAELRRFSISAGDDHTQILDGMDTMLDGAAARIRHRIEIPDNPFAGDFFHYIPEWVVIYDGDEGVAWCNPECARLFGKPLEEILQEKLRRSNLINVNESHYSREERADLYVFPSGSQAWGRSHPFNFYHAGRHFVVDLTFQLNHYFKIDLDDEALIDIDRSAAKALGDFDGLLAAALESIPLAAALKNLDGSLVWCNWTFFGLVRRLSPKNVFYQRRENVYGKTSKQLFWLDGTQSERIAMLERKVARTLQPVIAYDSIHQEVHRLTLRFPIFDANMSLKYIGIVSMPAP